MNFSNVRDEIDLEKWERFELICETGETLFFLSKEDPRIHIYFTPNDFGFVFLGQLINSRKDGVTSEVLDQLVFDSPFVFKNSDKSKCLLCTDEKIESDMYEHFQQTHLIAIKSAGKH